MVHRLLQKLPEIIGKLPEPTQEDILNEPTYRRATPDFVFSNGGQFAKYFLTKADEIGLISDSSRIMCQRSPILKGAYPSPPNWHVDRMPGTAFNLNEHLNDPIPGAIASICSLDKIETTEFLFDGAITLNEPDSTEAFHKPGQYLEENQGLMNWTTDQIENQLNAGTVQKTSINPNAIYKYDSTYFHKPPGFIHDGGYRMIIRVNTPSKNFPHSIPINNHLLSDDKFFFTVSEDGSIWHKHAY